MAVNLHHVGQWSLGECQFTNARWPPVWRKDESCFLRLGFDDNAFICFPVLLLLFPPINGSKWHYHHKGERASRGFFNTWAKRRKRNCIILHIMPFCSLQLRNFALPYLEHTPWSLRRSSGRETESAAASVPVLWLTEINGEPVVGPLLRGSGFRWWSAAVMNALVAVYRYRCWADATTQKMQILLFSVPGWVLPIQS